MSFETLSLLLNWVELGALLAILFRLSSTFNLIANTQRELRRAIHHLGDRLTSERDIEGSFDGPGKGLVAPCWQAHTEPECTPGPDDQLILVK